MPRLLANLSIRKKLAAIALSSCGAAIVVACGSLLAYDLITAREAMIDDLRTTAAVIGTNSRASLAIAKCGLLKMVSDLLGPAMDKSEQSSGGSIQSAYASDPDMKEMLEEFVALLPERANELSSLLRGGDLEQLRRAVHQLKGAGGGYGFPQITEAAAAAEQRIKAKEALESVAAGVESLLGLIRSVQGYDPSRENRCAAQSPGSARS
jgi:HPt (histidine-containing phosphotransfer) domain-containing protein